MDRVLLALLCLAAFVNAFVSCACFSAGDTEGGALCAVCVGLAFWRAMLA